MNRSHTVWLDQLSSSSSTALAVGSGGVALPVFSMEMAGLTSTPLTKRELVSWILRGLWSNRVKLLALYAVYTLLRRLHSLSRSRQDAGGLPQLAPGQHGALFPSFIASPSCPQVWLYTRAWRVAPSVQRGRVFLLHGHREHSGRYEPLALKLNQAGFSVFAIDFQGHGRSGGARGYVESFSHYVQDAMGWIEHTLAVESTSSGHAPIFLLGHSLGATVALQLSRIQAWRRAIEAEEAADAAVAAATSSTKSKSALVDVIIEEEAWEEDETKVSVTSSIRASPISPAFSLTPSPSSISPASASSSSFMPWRIDGLVLSCPSLIPHPVSVSPLFQAFASVLADVLPRFGFSTVLPLSTLSEDVTAVARFEADPLCYRGVMSARFGHEMLQAMSDTRQGLSDIDLPLLVLQGRRDQIVAPKGAQFLYDKAASRDKTLKWYDRATHDLYLERQPTQHQFATDVVEWLQRHTAAR